jgi:malonyl-CoA decarboxylase
MTHGSHPRFFADLLNTIGERGRHLFRRPAHDTKDDSRSLIALCHALISGRGEASAVTLAGTILARYKRLDAQGQQQFFAAVLDEFGVDDGALDHAIAHWQDDKNPATASQLHFASEPKRQDMLRKLNRADGGTLGLVHMRVDLLNHLATTPALHLVDRDFLHLLRSWFNRGFLVLRRIDWSTPANILEKIIRYEAVHTIGDWDDLRRRIDPIDRRCYAFFHPALNDEPLIFVEVALTHAIPQAIAPLLAAQREMIGLDEARIAVFYSISNCQRGLDGVSFGPFLIKQVVEDLRRELPNIEHFITLSPVPQLIAWLRQISAQMEPAVQEAIAAIQSPHWYETSAHSEKLKALLEPLIAAYFIHASDKRGRPFDPVARFHLGNGAQLHAINWLGDRSMRALHEGAGLMVNYLYDLNSIEANHEAYANDGERAIAPAIRKLVKPDLKARLDGLKIS